MAKEKKEIRLSADFDNTYDEILLDQQVSKKKDGITDIPIEKLHTFVNHPFKVQDDEKMDELVESIRENGILSPVVVRPLDDGYELISGHRRTHAAKRAGLTSVPAVIRDLSDDEATVLMVDANIQREFQYPSERAKSLKMKMEAMARLHKWGELQGNRNRELVGEEANMSGRSVQRYLSLNALIPDLLELVDEKKLVMGLALEICGLRDEVQDWLYEFIALGGTLTNPLIQKLKTVDETEGLTREVTDYILNEANYKKKARKITISEKKLDKYFPDHFEIADIEGVIYMLLDQWKRSQEGDVIND